MIQIPETYKDLVIGIAVSAVIVIVVTIFQQAIRTVPYWLQFLVIALPLIYFTFRASFGMQGIKILAAGILTFLATEILFPPYMIDPQGTITPQDVLLFAGTSSDFVVANVLNAVGVTGFFLFVGTYFIAPSLFLITAFFLARSDK